MAPSACPGNSPAVHTPHHNLPLLSQMSYADKLKLVYNEIDNREMILIVVMIMIIVIVMITVMLMTMIMIMKLIMIVMIIIIIIITIIETIMEQ